LAIDIRDRIVCTAFSPICSEKDIRSAMAFSAEQNLKSCIIDLSGAFYMKEELQNYKKISVAINMPFSGQDSKSLLKNINEVDLKIFTDLYVSIDKFLVYHSNIGLIRDFIKEANSISKIPINFCMEYSWIRNKETVDKICSVLEPYERHNLSITTYCSKPDRLNDIITIGKYLGSNGSCKFSYLGAIPNKKDGIIEILSSGFSFCGIPKQFIGVVV